MNSAVNIHVNAVRGCPSDTKNLHTKSYDIEVMRIMLSKGLMSQENMHSDPLPLYTGATGNVVINSLLWLSFQRALSFHFGDSAVQLAQLWLLQTGLYKTIIVL